MSRQLAMEKAVDILLGDKNQNADFYASLFEKYNYKNKAMTPISPLYFDKVNVEHRVILSEEAYDELKSIREFTLNCNKEIAFFIFGEEKTDGSIWLDTVVTTYDTTTMTTASFETINPFLNEIVKEYKNGDYKDSPKQVVCHGHTHTKIGDTYDNFSFGDLISYVEFTNLDEVFRNREMETIGCLLTPSGDYNFIIYDNNPLNDNFYIFNDVNVLFANGVERQLLCYQRGNYLKDNQKAL